MEKKIIIYAIITLILTNVITVKALYTREEIINLETQYKTINEKYLQIQSDGFTEVHEYTTAMGEKGFQIITYDGNLVNSEGFGIESKERTYTWDKTNK